MHPTQHLLKWRQQMTLVIAGGAIMGMALGVRHAQGIFQLPIITEHGWSRQTFGFAVALQNLVWGLAQPFTGMIADRFGSVRVMFAGLVCYSLGLYFMTAASSPFAFALADGVCIGVALSGTAFGAVYGALSRMVSVERRSWALGLAGAIGGLGQFFTVPVAQSLISGLGWSAALVVLAVIFALAAPGALVFSDSTSGPKAHTLEQSLRAALAEAFSHRGFWLLNLGFLACGFQLAFIASHLPAYLLDKGLTANHAMIALAIIALANVPGTYVCGWLGGRYSRKRLLSALYLVRALAMAVFVMLPLTPASLYAFSAAMGFIWLGTVPLTNGIVSQVFGVRYITTLFGFVFFGHQLGAFFGVWLGGLVYDATRSYDLIWLVGIALGLVAAALHYPIDERAIRRPIVQGFSA